MVNETTAKIDEAIITETSQAPNTILITDPRGLQLGEKPITVLSVNHSSSRKPLVLEFFSRVISFGFSIFPP